ncbi:MAG: hypothetical protein AB1393_13985 [Candidatus Edwardsbacteria bacterium]
MEEILVRLSSLPGVIGCFFVGRDGEFASQSLHKAFAKDKAQQAVLILSQTFEALTEMTRFKIDKVVLNTSSSRLFIRKFERGFLNILADFTADTISLNQAMTEALEQILTAKPKVPVAEVKPIAVEKPLPAVVEIPPPPALLDKTILESIFAVTEEYLGELAASIYGNQLADHKLDPNKLTKDQVMKLCFALQKDGGMIIGPSAAKEMADKMLKIIK